MFQKIWDVGYALILACLAAVFFVHIGSQPVEPVKNAPQYGSLEILDIDKQPQQSRSVYGASVIPAGTRLITICHPDITPDSAVSAWPNHTRDIKRWNLIEGEPQHGWFTVRVEPWDDFLNPFPTHDAPGHDIQISWHVFTE